MRKVQPLFLTDLFPPLHDRLLRLLSGLPPDAWLRPTVAPGWSVHDMVAHLLHGDIRRLSFQRDRLSAPPPATPVKNYTSLVDEINVRNQEWVAAARQISPPLLLEFLALTGPQVHALFQSLDPFAPAGASVAWAGETESPNWFDIAREYTEKWTHQQHIRAAVGRPGLTGRRWLHPVLDTFLRGLPHTFREVAAPPGTAVGLTLLGPAGGDWSLVKQENWELYAGRAWGAAAWIELDAHIAWQVFSKGLAPEAALPHARFHGDQALGRRLLDLVAIMA